MRRGGSTGSRFAEASPRNRPLVRCADPPRGSRLRKLNGRCVRSSCHRIMIGRARRWRVRSRAVRRRARRRPVAMAQTIREHIDATGLAQVIVVLKGAEGGAAPAGLAGVSLESTSTLSLRQVAAGLERAFVRTGETRDGAIATAARTAKGRG